MAVFILLHSGNSEPGAAVSRFSLAGLARPDLTCLVWLGLAWLDLGVVGSSCHVSHCRQRQEQARPNPTSQVKPASQAKSGLAKPAKPKGGVVVPAALFSKRNKIDTAT